MKRSKHYGDIKLWLEKVVNSCETISHLICVSKMINTYEKKLYKTYPKMKHSGLYYDIIRPVEKLVYLRYETLKKIKESC